MYQVVMRGFQYFVVNDRGVTCAGPFGSRPPALHAAEVLSRSRCC